MQECSVNSINKQEMSCSVVWLGLRRQRLDGPQTEYKAQEEEREGA